MPKFLDVPSWYDEYGKENSSIGAQTISVDAGTTVDISSLSAGIYKLKYVGDYIQSGTVTFALSSSLSITAQFMAAFQMDAFNDSWFELGEANLSMGTNVWARMLTFHNMCISSNYSDSVSNNMTISPTIGRSFTLQLNYMNSVSNMYAATVVDAGFSITLPGVTNTQSSRSIYAPTSAGATGQFLVSNGSGTPPKWAYIMGDLVSSANSLSIPIRNVTYASSSGMNWGIFLRIMSSVTVNLSVSGKSGTQLLQNIYSFDGMIYHSSGSRNLQIIGYRAMSQTSAPSFYSYSTSIQLSSADTSFNLSYVDAPGVLNCFYWET